MGHREFSQRFVYVVMDGQDLFTEDALLFVSIEINEILNKLVPQRVWENKHCATMDLY